MKTDWGFAAWIETENETILFDTGADDYILQQNLEKLQINPSKINLVAISHDHGDHTGGMEYILKNLKPASKIYLPNGLYPTLESNYPELNFILNDSYTEIATDIWLSEVFTDENRNIKEQALVINNEEKLYVITGCAHPGIAKMCEAIVRKFPDKKPELVTGGFHLMGTSQNEVEKISDKLKALDFQKIGASHCTGENSIEIFKEKWGKNFVDMNLGDSYIVQ